MKIKLLLVGKSQEAYLQKGIEIYKNRIVHYAPFEIVEIPELKQTAALSKDQIKSKEGDLILKKIKSTDHVILLDERGDRYNSIAWARYLEQHSLRSGKDIVFVVGGGYGFSHQVYDRANSMLSLSDMTFSHQLIRLIFVEQLYRAFTIIKGEPYHHE